MMDPVGWLMAIVDRWHHKRENAQPCALCFEDGAMIECELGCGLRLCGGCVDAGERLCDDCEPHVWFVAKCPPLTKNRSTSSERPT